MDTINNYYCFLKSAVVQGESVKADIFLRSLQQYNLEDLQANLPSSWYRSYLNISKNMASGVLADIPEIDNLDAYDFNLKSPPEITQKKLINLLFDNMEYVKTFFNVKKLIGFIEEYPTVNQERVDLVIRDGFDVVYPIEIKPKRANHETIGQIRKYCNFFLTRFNFCLYTEVRGVVLAGSFDKATMLELKKEGVRPLSYSLNNNRLELFDL